MTVEVDVFLAGWEIECCQPPPGVGDVVSWRTTWVADPAGPGATQVRWEVLSAPLGPASGRVLGRDPLHGWQEDAAETPADRGCFVADAHGQVPEQVPPLTGTVLGVHVVTQTYRLVGGHTYEPVVGAFELRPVPRSPRWFNTAEHSRPEVRALDSGVLVRLAVYSGRTSRSGWV